MGRGETDALDTIYVGNLLDESWERWLLRGIEAVRVYILPQQYNLFDTAGCKCMDLCQDLTRASADLRPPNKGYDAIGAKVVTTLCDCYKTADTGTVLNGRKQIQALIVVNKGCFTTTLSVFSGSNHIRQKMQVMGPKHQINPGKLFQQYIAFMLGNTSANSDNQILVFLLQNVQVFEPVVNFLFSATAYTAGIQQDQIRLFHRRMLYIPRHRQHGDDSLGIADIHLTAKGFHVKMFQTHRIDKYTPKTGFKSTNTAPHGGNVLEIFTVYRYYVLMTHIISFRDVSSLNLFEGFSCDIEAGCSVLIVTSREDVSTALTRLITGLSRPESGSILVNGQDVAGLEKVDLYNLRQQIGVVPSNGGLVSNLKLWENITLPLLYHSGEVTPEDEKNALDYLARLGYSGNIMALPAHLTHSERRVAVLVRVFLQQPGIVLYSNCIEGSLSVSREVFFQVTKEFHSAAKDRTSLYLTSSPNLAANLPVDLIVRMNEAVETVSRDI
jgi:phospholipid/cholesterol/gamma-HCH transport system ATP-binding protein